MRHVAALYVEKAGVYAGLPFLDVWDQERDANLYPGPFPVVAHPPCTGYCRMRFFSSPDPLRDACAFRARDFVRSYGGVLEHPAFSSFWSAGGLPRPGDGFDSFGGFSYAVDQIWFGHKVRKPTWLYICGVKPRDLPEIAFSLAYPRKRGFELMSHRERSATPVAFAEFLIGVSRLVPVSGTLGGGA